MWVQPWLSCYLFQGWRRIWPPRPCWAGSCRESWRRTQWRSCEVLHWSPESPAPGWRPERWLERRLHSSAQTPVRQRGLIKRILLSWVSPSQQHKPGCVCLQKSGSPQSPSASSSRCRPYPAASRSDTGMSLGTRQRTPGQSPPLAEIWKISEYPNNP